ncbi:MAG: hypothetical protein K6C08_13930 [Oscillospiraceae bacterium]|nr:hypothetical protein [Oscillospiraceae bacterium]
MEKKPFGKQLIMTLIITAVVALLVVIMSALKLAAWVPFLSLCVWSCYGMKLDYPSILSAYASILIGLIMGYLLGHAEQLGLPALVVFFVLVLVMLHCMANQKLPQLFNFYTAIFVTIGTTIPYELDILKSWAFGFVVLGLLPATVVYFLSRKKAAAPGAEDEK